MKYVDLKLAIELKKFGLEFKTERGWQFPSKSRIKFGMKKEWQLCAGRMDDTAVWWRSKETVSRPTLDQVIEKFRSSNIHIYLQPHETADEEFDGYYCHITSFFKNPQYSDTEVIKNKKGNLKISRSYTGLQELGIWHVLKTFEKK